MRFLKFLLVLLIILAAFGGGAIAYVRLNRGKVGPTVALRPEVFSVTSSAAPTELTLVAARVEPGPHVILFDAGLDPEGRAIDALLGALKASRDDVSDLFLTHAHFDHTSGAPLLAKARVHLGAGDVGLATGTDAGDSLVAKLLGKAMGTPAITVTAPITAAAVFPVGTPDAAGVAKSVKAFPVPGHTPGSYVFLYDGVLIAGDIMVFKQGRLDPTPRLNNPHPEENKAAIRSLKTQLANETIDIVCTAHGGCTPKGLGRNLLDELISRV